jgi:hypothetical protein
MGQLRRPDAWIGNYCFCHAFFPRDEITKHKLRRQRPSTFANRAAQCATHHHWFALRTTFVQLTANVPRENVAFHVAHISHKDFNLSRHCSSNTNRH